MPETNALPFPPQAPTSLTGWEEPGEVVLGHGRAGLGHRL
jgi:hypothetical protein